MSIFWNIKISKYLETAATKIQKKKRESRDAYDS